MHHHLIPIPPAAVVETPLERTFGHQPQGIGPASVRLRSPCRQPPPPPRSPDRAHRPRPREPSSPPRPSRLEPGAEHQHPILVGVGPGVPVLVSLIRLLELFPPDPPSARPGPAFPRERQCPLWAKIRSSSSFSGVATRSGPAPWSRRARPAASPPRSGGRSPSARATRTFSRAAPLFETRPPIQPVGTGATAVTPPAPLVELPDQGQEAIGGRLDVGGEFSDLVAQLVQGERRPSARAL